MCDIEPYCCAASWDSICGLLGNLLCGVCSQCPGDLDGNADVDGGDIAIVLSTWGPCPSGVACLGDLNGDFLVNGADLALLLRSFGPCGACCLDEGVCQYMAVSTCESMGGVAEPGATCGNAPCLDLGACCLDGGACLYVTEAACLERQGAFQGVGVSCDTVPCAPPVGACCLPDGSCAQMGAADCGAAGGTYQGDGVGCDDVEFHSYDRDLDVETNAGRLDHVSATYDPIARRLTWSATYRPNGNGVKPNAFTQVINNGPNPKEAETGVLAVFYFDATNPANPVLSVYAYHGLNNPNSYKDGDGNAATGPDGDCVASSLNSTDWVHSLTVTEHPDGSCTLGFDIDVTAINQHVPLFPSGDGNPWFGARFDSLIGYWLHFYKLNSTAYDGDGCLTAWNISKEGWNDVANEDADSYGCPQPPPPPPTGACCLPDGACAVLTYEECLAEGGSYQGDDVACVDLEEFVYEADRDIETNAGHLDHVYALYNPGEQRLVWKATFSANASGTKPKAFTQIINDGPDPVPGERGVYAIFYFDGLDSGNLKLTVYAYNGNGTTDSYKNGDGNSGTSNDGDCIATSLVDDSWIHELIYVNNADGTRTLGFDIDVGEINAHVPLFPSTNGTPWFGSKFGDTLGYWFHFFKMNSTSYYSNGCLKTWSVSKEGWDDRSDLDTDGAGCPEVSPLIAHWDFAEQSGDVAYDKVHGIGLRMHGDDGSPTWQDGSFGTCVNFDADTDHAACLKTDSTSSAAVLRELLQVSDAITVQIYCQQDAANANGSRILSWSGGTEVSKRNVSVIGAPGSSSSEFDNWTRLTTTAGTFNDGPDDAWEETPEDTPFVYTMTYDAAAGDTIRIYVNGQLAYTDNSPKGSFADWKDYHLIVGNESTLNRGLKGEVYDVKIWSAALADDAVKAAADAMLDGNDDD